MFNFTRPGTYGSYYLVRRRSCFFFKLDVHVAILNFSNFRKLLRTSHSQLPTLPSSCFTYKTHLVLATCRTFIGDVLSPCCVLAVELGVSIYSSRSLTRQQRSLCSSPLIILVDLPPVGSTNHWIALHRSAFIAAIVRVHIWPVIRRTCLVVALLRCLLLCPPLCCAWCGLCGCGVLASVACGVPPSKCGAFEFFCFFFFCLHPLTPPWHGSSTEGVKVVRRCSAQLVQQPTASVGSWHGHCLDLVEVRAVGVNRRGPVASILR